MILLSLVHCYSRFSIHPRHGHPLRRRVHPFHDSFQFVDGLFDVLVDDSYVEQMLVGTLQQLRLVGQFFQAPVELQNVHTTIMFKPGLGCIIYFTNVKLKYYTAYYMYFISR